jgi:hypothetical protein
VNILELDSSIVFEDIGRVRLKLRALQTFVGKIESQAVYHLVGGVGEGRVGRDGRLFLGATRQGSNDDKRAHEEEAH